MPTTSRERLIAAAFELFESQGYDATTVEEIAASAGAGRSTFFRHFRGKEDVVLPDHDSLLPRLEARLATTTPDSRELGLREAAAIVLTHYLDEGDTARARYRLASVVPAIRDREIASGQRYVRLFSRQIHAWLDAEPDGPLRAEIVASSIVIAHNHVLRRWLRAEIVDRRVAEALLDEALDLATSLLRDQADTAPTIVIHSGANDVEHVMTRVRRALTGGKVPGASDVGPT